MRKSKPRLRKYVMINSRGRYLWVNWTYALNLKLAKQVLQEDPDVVQILVYGSNLRLLQERLNDVLDSVEKPIPW